MVCNYWLNEVSNNRKFMVQTRLNGILIHIHINLKVKVTASVWSSYQSSSSPPLPLLWSSCHRALYTTSSRYKALSVGSLVFNIMFLFNSSFFLAACDKLPGLGRTQSNEPAYRQQVMYRGCHFTLFGINNNLSKCSK